MKTRTISLAFGGAILIALGGLGAVACSSGGSGTPNGGTGTSGNTGGGDASKDGTGTSGNTGTTATGGNNGTATSGNGGDDGGGTAGDDGGGTGGSDCGTSPTLHPVDAGSGPYCPFSAVGDAGNETCTFGQHCCEPAASAGTASTCQTDCNAQPDGGTDWACQGAANCPASQVCCAITTGAGQDPGCSYHFLHVFKGTVCAASCGAGQIQMCEDLTGECTTGACQTAKGKGGSFGLCL